MNWDMFERRVAVGLLLLTGLPMDSGAMPTMGSTPTVQAWKVGEGLRSSIDPTCGLHITGTSESGWNLARGAIRLAPAALAGDTTVVVPLEVNSVSDSRYWPRLIIKAIGRDDKVSTFKGSAYSPYLRASELRQDLYANITDPAVDGLEVLLSKETESPISVDICLGSPRLEAIPRQASQPSSEMLSLLPSVRAVVDETLYEGGKQANARLFQKFAADKTTACSRIGRNAKTSATAQVRYDSDLLEDAGFLFRMTGQEAFGRCAVQLISKISSRWHTLPVLDLPHAHVLRAFTKADGWLGAYLPGADRALLLGDVVSLMRLFQDDLRDPTAWWRQQYASNYKHAFTSAMGIACERYRFADYPDCRQRSRDEMALVLSALPDDGSSLEGPGYWNYSLVWILSYLKCLDVARRDQLMKPSRFLRNASHYRLHISVPGFREVIPYSDTDPDEYQRAGTALRGLGSAQADPLAVALAQRITDARWPRVDVTWRDIAWGMQEPEGNVIEREPTFVYLPDQGMAIWRSSWTDKDAELAFLKAGALQGQKLRQIGAIYGGHNHPDQGEVLLYSSGTWILKEDGYTEDKATRSHNSIEFNGHGQLGEGRPWFDAMQITPTAGPRLEIVKLDASGFAVRADLASAYPPMAQLVEWTRQASMERGGRLQITDFVVMTGNGSAEWQFYSAADGTTTPNGLCLGDHWLMKSTAQFASQERPFSLQWDEGRRVATGALDIEARVPAVVRTTVGPVSGGCSPRQTR